MNLPIFAYGNNVLKAQAQDVTPDYPNLKELIDNMWQTMSDARGCGLAAPQVGKSLKLFVADSKILYDSMEDDEREELFVDGDTGIREVFINAEILSLSEDKWEDVEACLSLPYLSGKVERSWSVEMKYQNQNFETITKTFSGMTARVILHEYDHTQGILYIDRVKTLSKKLMENKLKKLLNGKLVPQYKMKFK